MAYDNRTLCYPVFQAITKVPEVDEQDLDLSQTSGAPMKG
jgi:hypothetical protein